MSTILEEKKKRLIERIEASNDPYFINSLLEIEPSNSFDFDKEWENGYTPEEFIEEMKTRISNYPWKS